MSNTCEICGNADGNRTHLVREMMFGWRDEFTYLECGRCGCLQNVSVPADLGRYYGDGYYSVTPAGTRPRPVFDAMKKLRTRAFIEGKGMLGRLLLASFGEPSLPDYVNRWIRRAGVRQSSRLLEIGCGTGVNLLAMRSEGFTSLSGADPFIERDIDYGAGLRIRKAGAGELSGTFDFIVLEHAFEHIPDPHRTLRTIAALLAPEGTLIISVPLVNPAWEQYGVNWVQLDAPRHLYLHTETSFRILAKEMTIIDVEYDSGAVQFWGSEQYLQDIPLMDPRSHRINPRNGLFPPQAIARFEAQAAQLNAERRGDQATFYLRRTPALRTGSVAAGRSGRPSTPIES